MGVAWGDDLETMGDRHGKCKSGRSNWRNKQRAEWAATRRLKHKRRRQRDRVRIEEELG